MSKVKITAWVDQRTAEVRQVGRFNPENARALTKRLQEDEEGLRREAAQRIEEDPAAFVASAFDLTDRQSSRTCGARSPETTPKVSRRPTSRSWRVGERLT